MDARLTRRKLLRLAIATGSATTFAPLISACQNAATPAVAPTTAAPIPTATDVAEQTGPAATAAPATQPPKAKEPVTLRFHMRGGNDKSEPAIYVMRPDEWAAETGHAYKLEPIVGDYVGKVLALAAGGTLGDVMFTGESMSEHSRFVRGNLIEPVDDYLGTYGVKKSEWQKPIVDTLTHNGKMYGLPKTGHPGDSYIWINLKAFDEAGIAEPETYGNTFEDIVTWANQLSKGPKDARDVYGYMVNYGQGAVVNGVRQFGGYLINEDGSESLVDSDQVWEWANWTNSLVNEHKVHPPSGAITEGQGGIAGLFAAEKLAMVHTARSTHRAIKLAVQDKFPWTVIQFPRGPQAKGWGARVDTHSVTTFSKHKDVAFTLIYALADRRFAYLVAREQGYLTGRVDNIEAIEDLAEDHFIKLQYRCEQESEPYRRAKNLRTAEFWTVWTNTMDLIWLGQQRLDRGFMSALKTSLDEVLAKPE